MARFSSYNIVSKIFDTDQYFILNVLTGVADILTASEYQKYKDVHPELLPLLMEKGYVMDEETEKKLHRAAYLDFLDRRDEEEIQIFFVPTYQCNFKCSYCYQEEYSIEKKFLKHDITDAFFKYIFSTFQSRKKYITLFGGEPLLMGEEYKREISYFLDQCKSYNFPLSVVTNGYYLLNYLDELAECNLREIQVTLDGTAAMHNQRRYAKKGEDTFTPIVTAIDHALKLGITINLRVVVDRQNIDNLPNLAKFAIDRGWTSYPNFKTQLGRNYELHSCQNNHKLLFSRVEMYQQVYRLIEFNPELLQFHKPAFSVAHFLAKNGYLPEPVYDACPGTKSEWAFDFTGSIFSCTATVGKAGEELGTFFPEVKLDNKLVAQWENRDVMSIPECKECNVQLICGGGCAAIAKNTFGRISAPDCRPVGELLGLGLKCYYKDLFTSE